MDNIIIAKELLHLAKEIVGIINPNDMLKWKQQAEQLDNREWENRDYSLKEISEMNENQISDEEKEKIEKQNQEAAENAKHNDLMDRVFDAYVNNTEFPKEVKDKKTLRKFLSGATPSTDGSKSFLFKKNIILCKYMIHNGRLLFRIASSSILMCDKDIGLKSFAGFPNAFMALKIEHNPISSLEELKDKIIPWIFIHYTDITSLKGIPKSVDKLQIYSNEKLNSLEGIENCIPKLTQLYMTHCPNLTEVTLPSGNKIPKGLPAKHLYDDLNIHNEIIVNCDKNFENGFKELGYSVMTSNI